MLPTLPSDPNSGLPEIFGEWAKTAPLWKRRVLGWFLRAPLMIDQASTAQVKHQMRQAGADGLKLLFDSEARSLSGAHEDLMKRLTSASGVDRATLLLTLEYIESQKRKLRIEYNALMYAEEKQGKSTPNIGGEEESNHWKSRFDEFARQSNEPWRAEVLERALAEEALSPGSIGISGLNAIVTIDRRAFERFSLILDLCWQVGEDIAILVQPTWVDFRVGDGAFEERFGECLYGVDGLGLVAARATTIEFVASEPMTVSYDDSRFKITLATGASFQSLSVTLLGRRLAALCTKRPNKRGNEIFESWIASLPPETVERVHLKGTTAG